MKLLTNLNSEQKKAVTHTEGPLLIVAGAGTGKTTVITQRIAWLINQSKAQPDEILAVTFTDKAAVEMEERVDRLLPLGYYDLWISTFHSFCQRLLTDYALDIGLPGDFKLIDQTAQWLLVRQNFDRFNLDYYRPLGNPTKFIHALLKHFSRAKDEAVSPEEYLSFVENLKLNLDAAESTGSRSKIRRNKSQPAVKNFYSHEVNQPTIQELDSSEISRLEEVANAYHTYQQLLLENNALDFGDLINYTLKLFRQRPRLLKKFQNKFKYILVDEFQDTNWAQYELIKLLAAPKNNLTVVADDDQAIYKFRGASVANVTEFKKDFPTAKVISLITNYRSRQKILDLSYKFIQLNNPNRLEAQRLANKQISKKLISARGSGGIFEILQFTDQYLEAIGVVDKIKSLLKKDKSATYSDFAILVRANNQADIFIQELERQAIPYQFVASRGLYEKPIILDIISFLKVIDNYYDSPALWRVLNWPIFTLPSPALIELNYLARKKSWSLYETIVNLVDQKIKFSQANQSQEIIKEFKRILALLAEFAKKAREKRPREMILNLLQQTGYLQWVIDIGDPQTTEYHRYLEQFDKKLKQFEAEAVEPTTKLFLEQIKLELEAGETGSLEFDPSLGPETVKVMTIHSAKGLEFKYVFIVNLVDKRFPALDRREPIELPTALVKEEIPAGDIHLEEERRLFYVAMTRAKEGLFLTAAEDYGGKTRKKKSRFIYELDVNLPMPTFQQTDNTFQYSAQPLKTKITASRKILSNQQLNNQAIFQDRLLQRFSYTQLKKFKDCPYQYYVEYILRLPVPGTAYFSFGQSIHLALEKFFRLAIEGSADGKQVNLFSLIEDKETAGEKEATILPPLNVLLRLYEEYWIDDWYESAEQKRDYKKKGEKALRNYYRYLTEEKPTPYKVETKFSFKLPSPTGQVYTLTGKIDRIDKLIIDKKSQKSALAIIDYKTGRAPKEKAFDKKQLLIYQMAAEKVWGWPVVSLKYYYLEEGKVFEFLGQKEEIEKLQGEILELIEKIKKTDWEKILREHSCPACAQRII